MKSPTEVKKLSWILKQYARWADGTDYSLTKEPFDTDQALAQIAEAIEAVLPEKMEDPLGEQYNIGFNDCLDDVKAAIKEFLQ